VAPLGWGAGLAITNEPSFEIFAGFALATSAQELACFSENG
jgi:hypothetical protein